jgi:hypothetical protein
MSYISYKSSVSSDANGPLDLWAELNYDNTFVKAPIVVVMHGYSPTNTFGDVRANAQRLRDAGFFAISVAMRGRDGSDGVRDSGGVEIFDIYDAVERVKSLYASLVDKTNISITGYSGGGGNVMSALTKFPDYFRAGSSFFGMSDYGYHPQHGWYFCGAGGGHQSQMRTDIGDPTTGAPAVLDRYMARASSLASANNPYSEIHLFVNADEGICPAVHSTRYRDNAVADEAVPGEFSNIHLHIGQAGRYEDFNSDGIKDPDELQYWPHGFPSANQQNAAERWYRDRLLAGQIPHPVLNTADTLFVAGYVKTRPFFLWLGDGQNAAASLDYQLSASFKTFRMELLSSDKSVTGRLEVDVTDLAGELITVWLNDQPIEQFTASANYAYAGLSHGDFLVLQAGAMQKSADLNQDQQVDLRDLSILSSQWQTNGPFLPCDLNGDGGVSVDDLICFAEQWYAGKPQVVYGENLDSDPNWQRQGQWEFGQPAGDGGLRFGYPDPTSGRTGLNVFGVNLQGDYSVQVGDPYWLTLGPVDCTGFEHLTLEFARWLNTDEAPYMDCRIEVSNDNVNWTTVWRHDDAAFITDSRWTMVDYGLGDTAENQPAVYLRWGCQVLSPRVWPLSGWNIDDVTIKGKRIP